jgi:hypothetical protein
MGCPMTEKKIHAHADYTDIADVKTKKDSVVEFFIWFNKHFRLEKCSECHKKPEIELRVFNGDPEIILWRGRQKNIFKIKETKPNSEIALSRIVGYDGIKKIRKGTLLTYFEKELVEARDRELGKKGI